MSFAPERTAFDDTWTRLVGAPDTLLLVAEAVSGNIAGYLALASRRAGPFYTALGYENSAVFFKKTCS